MMLGRHISGRFNQELESIRTHALTMGGLVEQQLSLSLLALSKLDTQMAAEVIRNDSNVNEMEMAIDQACTRIIAKRQPTAKDLRLIISIIKCITELERIGDAATNISQVALEKFEHHQSNLVASITTLGRLVVNMLHQVLDAFARMDTQAATDIYLMDSDINKEYGSLKQQLMTWMQDEPESIPTMMHILFSAQALERVGDRCKNICEYIIYCVEGKDVRHSEGITPQVNLVCE